MKGIEIFIDESGDFGPYDARCPYYIVTMVFHETDAPLFEQIRELEYRLSFLNLEEHCIHTSPTIRGEGEYHGMESEKRRKALSYFSAFVRKSPLKFKSFFVRKADGDGEVKVVSALREAMDTFLSENHSHLSSYGTITVAYDKGQYQLSKLISDMFQRRFSNIRITKTLPIYSRIFQVADFVCTMKRIALRLESDEVLTRAEKRFFGSDAKFRKLWYLPITTKEWR